MISSKSQSSAEEFNRLASAKQSIAVNSNASNKLTEQDFILVALQGLCANSELISNNLVSGHKDAISLAQSAVVIGKEAYEQAKGV